MNASFLASNAATAASKGKAFTTPYPQEPKSLQQAAAGTEITPGAVLAKYGFTPDELKNAGPEDVAAQMVERGQRMGYNQAQIISNIGEVTGAQRGGGALSLYDLGLAKLNGTLDKNTKLIQSNKNAAKDAAATYKDDLDDALDQTGKAISERGRLLSELKQLLPEYLQPFQFLPLLNLSRMAALQLNQPVFQ